MGRECSTTACSSASTAGKTRRFSPEDISLPSSHQQSSESSWLHYCATENFLTTHCWRSTARNEEGRKEGRTQYLSFTLAPWDHMLRSWSLFSCRKTLWLGFYKNTETRPQKSTQSWQKAACALKNISCEMEHMLGIWEHPFAFWSSCRNTVHWGYSCRALNFVLLKPHIMG